MKSNLEKNYQKDTSYYHIYCTCPRLPMWVITPGARDTYLSPGPDFLSTALHVNKQFDCNLSVTAHVSTSVFVSLPFGFKTLHG